MVIDFHNHLGVDLGAELSQTADELLRRMDDASIDRAVAFPFPGCPMLAEGNATVLTSCKRHQDRLIPFLGINPREHRGMNAGGMAALLEESGAQGVIIDPCMHHFSLRHSIVDPLTEACEALGLPLVVHMVGQGLDDCQPVAELAGRHPGTTIVVSPLVYCPGWETIVGPLYNIFADTAMPLNPQHIVQLVKVLGVGRVLFGSETPYMSPVVELAKIEYTGLALDVQEQLLWRNTNDLLGDDNT